MDVSAIVWVAGILGTILGIIATASMLHVSPNSPFYWFQKHIVTACHSWITVVHELGHWFWGLPSGILARRILPRITFDDSHNAQTVMPMVGGPLRWILHPFLSFGGYISPVMLGGFFVWLALKGENSQLIIGEAVLIVLSVVMVLGSRSWKTFLFCLYPIFLAVINGFLIAQGQYSTDPFLSDLASAFILFLGAILLVGGVGDILVVNTWAVIPKKMKFFFTTDFGLLTGWSHNGVNGDPSQKGWMPKPMGPFFIPHVALLIFDALTIWILVVIYRVLTYTQPLTSEAFWSFWALW